MESTAGETMLSWLPPEVFSDNTLFAALLDAWGVESDKIASAIEELTDAAFIATAPTWALEKYEEELGYPVNPSVDSEDDRRARILSFSRRSSQTATVAAIEELLAAFSDGETVVTSGANTVDIEFVSPGGIPDDFEFIEAFLRRVIPAHVEITFTFNFYTWGELRAETLTWAQLRASGKTWAELGEDGPDIDGDLDKVLATKTIAFTGAAGLGATGNLPIMAVTGGRILLEAVSIKCTEDLVAAGGTIQFFADEVGASGAATTPTDLAAGAITTTTIDNGEFHVKASDIHIIMDPAGGGIYGTISTNNITDGTIVVEAVYKRMTAAALLE